MEFTVGLSQCDLECFKETSNANFDLIDFDPETLIMCSINSYEIFIDKMIYDNVFTSSSVEIIIQYYLLNYISLNICVI